MTTTAEKCPASAATDPGLVQYSPGRKTMNNPIISTEIHDPEISAAQRLRTLIRKARSTYLDIEDSTDESDEMVGPLVASLNRINDEIIDLNLDTLHDERLRARYLIWAETLDPFDGDFFRRLIPALAGRRRK